MNTSTGGAAYSSPFHQYVQPPPFSENGDAGALTKVHADLLIEDAESVLVTGLAGDWCVLDSALNAKALYPEKDIYFVLDALRPAYLPAAAGQKYLKQKNNASQLYNGGIWLHDPADVARVLKQAGVKVIMANQIV